MPISVGIVKMVPIESIIISDRARQDLGDLDSFESNMKEVGLTSPLTMKDNKDGTYRLLAGERRYTILKRNGNEFIPAKIYEEDLSDIQIKIIEKSENFYRKDFESYELDKLTLEIHEMQQSLFGKKLSGPNQQGWSTQDTAEMLGYKDAATVTRAIKRAEAREAFPQLFENCKTASDADKILKKVDEAVIKQTIANRLENDKSQGKLHEMSKCYIIGDFFEGVKKIPDGIMHLVEIDPPYAIDLMKAKKSEGESKYTEDYNEVGGSEYLAFLSKLFQECYRVMSDHSWLICWFAPEPWFEDIYQEIIKSGFQTTRMCGIWPKHYGQTKRPESRLANTYEMFFYAWKGQPALNKPGHGNEFNIPPIPANQKVHPTERPIELMKELYDTFAFPGSRVLIPFLGSGNGIIAAHQLGMSPIGFELSKAYRDSFMVKVHLMQ